MKPFTPSSTTLRGRLEVAAGIDRAFPLFSPVGERLWVPGWDPELLHPPGIEWAEGQIFRTREERGEAVWVVTRLDRERHRAEYHRIEPGRYVARVGVRCDVASRDRTAVAVEYTFVGLSDAGNADIAAMSREDYDAKLVRWTGWIERHLASTDGGNA